MSSTLYGPLDLWAQIILEIFPDQNRTAVSSPEVVARKNQVFVPQSSPPPRLTRASHHQKPTCLVFGPLREAVYSNLFFVTIVKCTRMH